MPYSYKNLHFNGLPHAFMNTLLFLDYDRTGFDYPVVPFHVNCYGSSVVRNRGGSFLNAEEGAEPDPPAPSPKLCFDVGAATAKALIGKPLSGRSDRLIQLVSRVPYTQEPPPLARQ